MPGRDTQQTADDQAATDCEREPGNDHEREDEDPLRHGATVGIGSDGYVLKGTFLPTVAGRPARVTCVKGADKQKKLAKKAPQKSLKEKRAEKRAAKKLGS